MNQTRYSQAVTSLKGLFILIITLHNCLLVTPLFSGVPGIAFIKLFTGPLANSMFFILSGFLLSGNYRDRIRQHALPFRDYLLRRLKKLYPMFILSNAVLLVIEIIRYGASAINIKKIAFTALLLGSPYNNPTWFLSVLFACYILFFALCHFAKSPTHYISGLVIAVCAGYSLMNEELKILFMGPAYGTGYMCFFLGCVLAEVYPLISEKLHRLLQPLFLVLLPLLTYLMLSYGVEIISGDPKVSFPFVICPMILYLALVKGPCRKILELKWLVFLGKISSNIFFWHLVLYLAFCDLYAAFTGGGTPGEVHYFVYLVLLILFCAGLSKLEAGKSAPQYSKP